MPAPKESVGDRSDSVVFGETKETSTDADLFHEVKERMDQKKETMGYRGFADARKHVNHNVQWIRSHNSYQQDSRRRGYVQNLVSGIKREFRVVKDNRLSQNAKGEFREVKTDGSHSGNEQKLSIVPDKIVASDQTARHSDGYIQSAGLKKISEEVTKPNTADLSASKRLVDEETNATIFTSKGQSSESNCMAHSNPSSSNSVIGVHSSFSDPVHVPSPISRSAGKVGAIRRELGVVDGRRQSSDHSVLAVLGCSSPTSLSSKDISLEAQASSQPVNTSKRNVLDQMVVQVPILRNATSSKSVQGSYHNSKLHPSSGFQQKANQSNMEWKPKSVQKPTNAHCAVDQKNSTATSHTYDYDNLNAVDTGELCEKFVQISAARNLHVIIPQHLQVPDLVRLKLTFGSFGAKSDSTDDFSSTFQDAGNTKSFADGPSISTSASGVDTMAFSMDYFVADRGVILNDQARPFQLGSSASATGSEELGPGLGGTITSENIEQYDEIGLVQSDSPPYNLSEGLEQYQNNPSLPNFSEQPVQQQQQPVAQVYPQVHIPQYPNFVPFRHFFSPVYVPPMAVSNYTGNPAFPLSSSGNSYVVMPRGNSHINVGSMKFTNPQYKSIASGSPTAYGHPTGFSISLGTVGMVTGLEDMARHKFKDNNPYVPNPLVETSDMWIQTPQELTSLQSSYYNLPAQAPHVGFMPVHASHAAFNAAAQPSHQHYPGLYHPQPPSMASPHHTMHQHVPSSFCGSIGVGVAAPGPQVGAYQQTQVSNFNWTTNF